MHRARFEAAGHLAPAEIDELLGSLREHLERDDTLSIYALFFQAWGCEPR